MPPTGISVPSSSTYLPPPPGPPGIYRSFFLGGSDDGFFRFGVSDVAGPADLGRLVGLVLRGRVGIAAVEVAGAAAITAARRGVVGSGAILPPLRALSLC